METSVETNGRKPDSWTSLIMDMMRDFCRAAADDQATINELTLQKDRCDGQIRQLRVRLVSLTGALLVLLWWSGR